MNIKMSNFDGKSNNLLDTYEDIANVYENTLRSKQIYIRNSQIFLNQYLIT